MAQIKHIALVKFKAGTSAQTIDDTFAALGGLKQVIPGIVDYCHGPNDSPEGLSQGYTHGFIMTFKDTSARDAYLPHPEHEKIKATVLPHVEAVVILDFAA